LLTNIDSEKFVAGDHYFHVIRYVWRAAVFLLLPTFSPAVCFRNSELLFAAPDLQSSCNHPHPPATWAIPVAAIPVDPLRNWLTKALPHLGESPAPAAESAALSLTRALGLRVNRIVIDAGHGGADEGAVSPNGLREKDAVLDVALRTTSLVRSSLGIEVVLTRANDRFIPLHRRTAIANENRADLFLSIHANSSPNPATSGPETYFLNFNSHPAALDVAARENAGSEKSVASLRDLVQAITLNDKIAESETFARMVQASVPGRAGKGKANARDRGTKRAPFVVLIGASMPSALAEIGFLSNPNDASNLRNPEYRQRIAEALCAGISRYAQSLDRFETSSILAFTPAVQSAAVQ
jgi:N-acetylmuramoyl-L-alanine amidase